MPTSAVVFGTTFVLKQVVAVELDSVPMGTGHVHFVKVHTTAGPIIVWRSDRPTNYKPLDLVPESALAYTRKELGLG